MKKFISLVLAVLFCLLPLNVSVWAASSQISLTSVDGNPGDELTVDLIISGNPGLAYLKLKVGYPNDDLALIKVEDTGLFAGTFTTSKTIDVNPYVITWTSAGDLTENGVVASLTFKVSDTASTGEKNISLSFEECYDENFDDVEFDVTPGKITVKAKPIPVTGLSLDKTTATVETGDGTLTLTPIFSHENATNKNLTWTSDNESVATVEYGVVTLIKKGVATITATTEDGGYTAFCVVTVNCSHSKRTDYPAENSTCKVEGHEAYTVCDECGEIINGSDAKLPLADHTYVEKADAQYLKSSATCSSKVVYYKSCSICGINGTETFEYGEVDNSNHVGDIYIIGQKEATCYEEGYTGDIYCQSCNTKIAEGTVIEKNAHNPASVWSTDDNYHWKDCQTVGCGNIIDKEAHSGGTATCTKKAICEVCGVEYGTVDAENHVNTEIRNATVASCTTDGYTGDIYCKDCGVKIAEGTVIPAGHQVLEEPVTEYTLGDVNNDGYVNAIDATFVLQYYADIITSDDLITDVADLDGNAKINSEDATLILQKYANIIEKFPIE